MRRSAGFKYMTPSQVNIPSTHKLTILHLQPELITAFFLRHTSARGERVHGSLIPPPSLWPGRELRKYHYCPLADHRAYGCRPYLCALGFGLPNQMDSRLPPEEREGAAMRFSRFIENGIAFIK
jgi:hypothetical protein